MTEAGLGKRAFIRLLQEFYGSSALYMSIHEDESTNDSHAFIQWDPSDSLFGSGYGCAASFICLALSAHDILRLRKSLH